MVLFQLLQQVTKVSRMTRVHVQNVTRTQSQAILSLDDANAFAANSLWLRVVASGVGVADRGPPITSTKGLSLLPSHFGQQLGADIVLDPGDVASVGCSDHWSRHVMI